MATSDARTRVGTIAVLGMASCLGGDDGAGGGGSFDEAAAAVTDCRVLALHATYNPATQQGVDDQELPTPPMMTLIPASVASVNPYPGTPAKLSFEYELAGTPLVVHCSYFCPTSGGVCTSTTLALTSCSANEGSYDAGDPISFTEVTLSRYGLPPPSNHGLIELDVELVEIGTCPGGCANLDDALDCTIDQCLLVDDVPTSVHIDVCGEGLPPGIATTVGDSLRALIEADPPVQQGADLEEIDLEIAAGITGQVMRHDGYPASGATVTIEGHEEYGTTETDANGEFVMVVEGGGLLTVSITSAGYLPVHRAVHPTWQGWARTDDVVLTPRSMTSTSIDLAEIDEMAVALGDETTDTDGTRRGVLLVPEGTEAELEFADPEDENIALDTMTVRITEYTVGEDGPARMPAPLPPESAYTYAVEISLDESTDDVVTGGEDAKGVVFSAPVFFYVENFLDFEVGKPVPVGRYDRQRRAWLPEDNGIVLRIVDIDAGAAVLSFDEEEGAPASQGELDALGITDAELERLADLYAIDDELWRAPLTHLSPCDLNWPPFEPPGDCSGNCDDPPAPPDDDPDDDPCEGVGSILECENQILGERIGVRGTDLTLNYRSDRVPGHAASRTVQVPLTASEVRGSLLSIDTEVLVAGKRYASTIDCTDPACEANERLEVTWDGRDRFGRLLQGRQRARVTTTFKHPVAYGWPREGAARAFARATTELVNSRGDRLLGTRAIKRTWEVELGGWDARSFGLGGWTLSQVHAYEPATRTVRFGDGRRKTVDSVGQRIRSVHEHTVNSPTRVAVEPDGSILTVDRRVPNTTNQSLWRIHRDGTKVKVVDMPSMLGPEALRTSPDGTIYAASLNFIHRLDQAWDAEAEPPGWVPVWTVVAGDGGNGTTLVCEGQPATETDIKTDGAFSFAVAADGGMMIARGAKICRMTPDGRLEEVYSAPWSALADLAPDGSIVFGRADTVAAYLGRVPTAGDVVFVTAEEGTAEAGPIDEALTTSVSRVNALIATNSEVFFSRTSSNGGWTSSSGTEALRVVSGGKITTLAGTQREGCESSTGYCGDGDLATRARLRDVMSMALHPSGALVLGLEHHVAVIEPALRGLSTGEEAIPDGDVAHIFDPSGRHTETRDLETGLLVTAIAYHADGTIDTITDWRGIDPEDEGHITTVERDDEVVTVTGPDGHVTTLLLNEDDWLVSVEEPDASDDYEMTYHDGEGEDGLLASFKKPEGTDTSNFTYDELGRLIADEDPLEQTITLTRTDEVDGWSVEHETPLGVAKTHRVERPVTGVRGREVVRPGDLVTTRTKNPAGQTVTTYPDGTTVTTELAPDPRWGSIAPYVALEVVEIPTLPTKTVVRRRDVTSDEGPFDFGTLTEETWVNPEMDDGEPEEGEPKTTRTFVQSTFVETITSPEGRILRRILDEHGRLATIEPPGLGSSFDVTFTYDTSGRLLTRSQGTGGDQRLTEWAYGGDGQLSLLTNALAQETGYTWDDAARLEDITHADTGVLAVAHDENGNLTSLTPPGQAAHVFGQDDLDQMTSYDPPESSNTTSYTYTADRNVDAETRPGSVVLDYQYDATTGRLEAIERTSTEKLELSYDSVGRLETTEGPSWTNSTTAKQTLTTAFAGRFPTSEELTGGTAAEVSWTYDAAHRVASEEVDDDHTVAMTYDDDDLLLTAGELTIVRDEDTGKIDSISNTHSSVTFQELRTYDDFGELESLEFKRAGATILTIVYVRDDLGRIVTQTEDVETALGGNGTPLAIAYEYDDVGRLLRVTRGGTETEEYAYDTNGNRTSAQYDGGTTTTASHTDEDRIASHSVWTTVSYTPNGEVTRRSKTSPNAGYQNLAYDAFGNTTSSQQYSGFGGTVTTYDADGRGRRVWTKVGISNPTRWVWSDALRPAAQLDHNNAVTHRYVYADGVNVPDLVITSGGDRWRLIKDHLGSVRWVFNVATQAVVRSMQFDAFGRVTASTGTLRAVPFGFAGGIWEPETGLVRFGARDYDPETGRFTAKDPIRFEGGDANIYVYVGNDPVNATDSSGERMDRPREICRPGFAKCLPNCEETVIHSCQQQNLPPAECKKRVRSCEPSCRAQYCRRGPGDEPERDVCE